MKRVPVGFQGRQTSLFATHLQLQLRTLLLSFPLQYADSARHHGAKGPELAPLVLPVCFTQVLDDLVDLCVIIANRILFDTRHEQSVQKPAASSASARPLHNAMLLFHFTIDTSRKVQACGLVFLQQTRIHFNTRCCYRVLLPSTHDVMQFTYKYCYVILCFAAHVVHGTNPRSGDDGRVRRPRSRLRASSVRPRPFPSCYQSTILE